MASKSKKPQITADPRLLQVGGDLFEVYGDSCSGWSSSVCEGLGRLATSGRYRSVDELIFALANLAVTMEGEA